MKKIADSDKHVIDIQIQQGTDRGRGHGKKRWWGEGIIFQLMYWDCNFSCGSDGKYLFLFK